MDKNISLKWKKKTHYGQKYQFEVEKKKTLVDTWNKLSRRKHYSDSRI